MRTYELTFILNPNLDEETVSAEIKKIEDQIKSLNGKVLEIQPLGLRSLTYEIKKHRQGNYITIYYEAEPGVSTQIENTMKLNESILRFLTIVLRPSEYTRKEKEEKETPQPESSE
ncbi:MAG: 30S ribosomal protein S6 [candidate division Zixibacteria bacterium 4484_95]|nr:MAG: 30S ribosomal protein S6 [candidate division Zixibacteria bacterium 4484_95]